MEREHSELPLEAQEAQESYLASVDNVALIGLIEDLRARPAVLAEPEDLASLTRAELNARAVELGIDAPDKLGSKQDVAQAIQDAESAQTDRAGVLAGGALENAGDGGAGPAAG